jgi:hypothetical protein
MTWKANVRIVVSPIARQDRHFMPSLGQTLGKIGEVLGRRDDVRIKTLVEK